MQKQLWGWTQQKYYHNRVMVDMMSNNYLTESYLFKKKKNNNKKTKKTTGRKLTKTLEMNVHTVSNYLFFFAVFTNIYKNYFIL